MRPKEGVISSSACLMVRLIKKFKGAEERVV